MAKQLRISIPRPCHEKWEDMDRNAQGAFCQSCQKNVIDFSNKTENEIYDILTKTKDAICGRVTPFQLTRPVYKTEVANGRGNWRVLAVTALGVLFSGGDVMANDVATKT
jgi:hypothetical protein